MGATRRLAPRRPGALSPPGPGRVLLPAALLAALLWAGPARAADRADAPATPILPGAYTAGEPVPAPATLPTVVYPFPGLQILIGPHFLDVRSDHPKVDLGPGSTFSTGATLGLDYVGRIWRFGYVRRVYRHELPAGTEFHGDEVDFLALESDGLWLHGGLRPWKPFYLALGLGAEQRRYRFTLADQDSSNTRQLRESALAGDVLLEYDFSLPYAIQVRYARDLTGPAIEISGWTVLIAYTIPL